MGGDGTNGVNGLAGENSFQNSTFSSEPDGLSNTPDTPDWQQIKKGENIDEEIITLNKSNEDFIKSETSESEKTGSDFLVLPEYENAIIPEEKLTNYALNLDHPVGKNKAIAFEKALGYNKNNAEQLVKNIKDNLHKFSAVEKPDMGYGKRYQVDMDLTGLNGKTAKVRTAWIQDKTTGEMRLVSVYVID